MVTQLDRVKEVMGGMSVVPQPVNNTFDWINIAKNGLSIKAVRALQERMSFTNKEVSRLISISESTLQRRLNAQSTLSVEEGEKAIHVATIIAKGIAAFDDEDDFREWIHINNPALNNLKPIELLDSSIGREQILNLLNRIEHTIYS